MISPPPCAKSSPSDSGNVRKSGATATSAKPPSRQAAATRSPSLNPEPSGALRTTPATSVPGTNGSGGFIWYSPRVWRTSGNATPAARTSISTPLPGVSMWDGSGSGMSTCARAELGPDRSTIWTARMRQVLPRRGASGGEAAPEVHHGVGAPGAPARVRAPRVEPLECMADAQVARQEHVRIAKRAHRHVRHGPRPDTRDLAEHAKCLGYVGASVKAELAVRAESSERAQRQRARAREWQRRRIQRGERVRGGEAVRQRAVRLGQRLAVFGRQPAENGPGRLHGHLLAQDRPHAQLEPVHAAGDAQAGAFTHERRQRAVLLELG